MPAAVTTPSPLPVDFHRLTEEAWRQAVLVAYGYNWPSAPDRVEIRRAAGPGAVLAFEAKAITSADRRAGGALLLASRTEPRAKRRGVRWIGPHEVWEKLSSTEQTRLDAACGSGDVLGRAAGALAEDLTRFLEAEFLADLYSRLESINSDPERRIPLARVFIDLPLEGDAGFCASSVGIDAEFAVGRDVRHRLLIGGAGQGKTTLGQYLCQIHRAVLLEARLASLGPDAEGQVSSMLRQAESLRPRQVRFPIRVPLYRFAADLDPASQDPLRSWILARFRLQLERDVDAEALAAFLDAFPVLLVLDGLDEVPVSANRSAVVQAVRRFLEGIVKADVVAIATTRPQGYRGEFSWPTMTLAALPQDQAQEYATRLIRERNRTDKEREGLVQGRFKRALQDPRAASLTRSPLQVTILCALLERQGQAPRLRYSLFRDYFRVIYDRERDREIASVRVLHEHEPIVRRLHWEVGFLLHVRAEVSDGQAASLSRAEFAAVVDRLLSAKGFPTATLVPLRDAIVEAALLRLVFLVGVGEDGVGFEIRSLQEFAAAERIVEADGPLVERRLTAIATSAHWRNVFAFVAGHGEADHEPVAEVAMRVTEAAGEQSPGLAAELLAEGVGASAPGRRASLLELATSGLTGPLGGRVVEVLATEAPDRVTGAARLSVRAWVRADQAGIPVTVEQLDEDDVPDALGQTLHRTADLEEAVWRYSPERWAGPHGNLLLSQIMGFWTWEQNKSLDGPAGIRESWRPMDAIGVPDVPAGAHPGWALTAAVGAFCAAPSAASLADVLQTEGDLGLIGGAGGWPWPVQAFVGRSDPGGLAALARAGEFGDTADWLAAEARWSRGVTKEWTCEAAGTEAPLSQRIGVSGSPPFAGWYTQRVARADLVQEWRLVGGRHRPLSWHLALHPELIPTAEDPAWAGARTNGDLDLIAAAGARFDWVAPWPQWLDDIGLRRRVGQPVLAASGLLSPSLPGLLAVAAASLRVGASVPIPASLLASIIPPDDRLAADHLLLTLTQDYIDPRAESELRRLLPVVETLAKDLIAASKATRQPHFDDALRVAISITEGSIRNRLADELADRIASHPSGLDDASVATPLELPLLPGISAQTETATPAEPPPPELLTSIKLTDFKGHASLCVEREAPGGGQWTVFLGDNGVGKTSILRAIALALLPAEIGQTWVSLAPASFVAFGAASARASIGLAEATWTFELDGQTVRPGARPESLFMVGYGPHRGSVQGPSEPDFSALAAVNTLFHDGASLTHPERWLQSWYTRALEGKNGDPRFFEALKATLVGLLPGVTAIDVTSAGTRVSGPDLRSVPLSALSDGYLTTAGWILDLVGRWAEWARARNLAVDGDFASQMTGLVLIDEIDLHLHPQWQRELIVTLRTRFPNLTFVATTHNPITLLGARAGEICVLRRGAEPAFRDIPAGANADQVLTGEWFGLASTVDAETLALIDRQRELLRTAPDSPDVDVIRSQLATRLGARPTGVERLVESVAAEVLDEEAALFTSEQVQAAREKLLARVRERKARL